MKDALNHLDALYSDEELRLVIQRRQQALMDERDALAWATQEGEKLGEAQGLKKGGSRLLERILTHKFGPLPEAIRQRIQQADIADLEAWSLNVIDAQYLDDVFRQGRRFLPSA